MFTAEKTGRSEGFQFLALAQIKSLADVNERGHRRIIARAEGARDDRADMGRGHGLRRSIAGVPMILMSRVQNEAEIARRSRNVDQSRAIHYARDFFQPLGIT